MSAQGVDDCSECCSGADSSKDNGKSRLASEFAALFLEVVSISE